MAIALIQYVTSSLFQKISTETSRLYSVCVGSSIVCLMYSFLLKSYLAKCTQTRTGLSMVASCSQTGFMLLESGEHNRNGTLLSTKYIFTLNIGVTQILRDKTNNTIFLMPIPSRGTNHSVLLHATLIQTVLMALSAEALTLSEFE